MKKTDIGVVVVMYAICAFFYSMTVQLKPESQTYPTFTIVLLFGLTTLYLLQMLFRAKKFGVESGKDEVFKNFKAKQFFVCFVMVVLYLVMMKYLGFYISTVIFMAVVLLFLKVPVLHSAIVLVAIILLVYLAFGLFLKVKLPQGELIELIEDAIKASK